MLFDVLSNRACINVLKILYDNESSGKTSYSLKKSDILQMINYKEAVESAIITLAYERLILKEEAEGELHLSITEKGKQFIAVFDSLVVLMSSDEPVLPQKKIEIKYDLTSAEKKLLLTLYQMQKESGKEISLSSLARELYPYEDSDKKKSAVSSIMKKLQELNLVEKMKNGRMIFASVTESGEKLVNNKSALNVFQ